LASQQYLPNPETITKINPTTIPILIIIAFNELFDSSYPEVHQFQVLFSFIRHIAKGSTNSSIRQILIIIHVISYHQYRLIRIAAPSLLQALPKYIPGI